MSNTSLPMPARWRAATAALAALLAAAPVRAERPWPQLGLPADAQAWSVGEQLNANGVPLRVRGFLSARPVAELAREMRERLGEPVAENRVGGQTVLGHAERGFYLTVQLAPVAGGTRALVAVADLVGAQAERGQTEALRQRWQARLPAGSQILSHSRAQDGLRASTQWVYRNGASAELNGQALTVVLAQDGLLLEQSIGPEPGAALGEGGRVLLFKGRGQEASAVIAPLPQGGASVVLNTVAIQRAQERP